MSVILSLAQAFLISESPELPQIDVIPGERLHGSYAQSDMTPRAPGQKGCELCTLTDLPPSSPAVLFLSLELWLPHPPGSGVATAWWQSLSGMLGIGLQLLCQYQQELFPSRKCLLDQEHTFLSLGSLGGCVLCASSFCLSTLPPIVASFHASRKSIFCL